MKYKMFYENHAPQANFNEKRYAAGKTYQTKCFAGQIFGLSPDGGSVLLT